MKRITKLLSVVLAMAMMLTLLVAPAFAATSNTNVDVATHTFEAYQIFSGTQAEDGGALGEIAWGNGVNADAFLKALKASTVVGTDFADAATAVDVANVIVDLKADTNKLNEIAILADANKSGTKTDMTDNGDGSFTINTPGYYVVVDTTEVSGKQDTKNLSVLQVSTSAKIQPKAAVPEVDKDIVEDGQLVKTNEASIGDTITYRLTSNVPVMTGYDYYYFMMDDTLSTGLTYQGDSTMVVKIGDKTLKQGTDYEITSGTSTEDGTYNGGTTLNINFINFLKFCTDNNIAAGTAITVDYQAKLNSEAKIYVEGNPNKVDLTYSNNPNQKHEGTPSKKPSENEPTGKTPEHEVITYTTALRIHKTDAAGNILTGAAFKITGDGVSTVITTGKAYVADKNGTFYKLTDGTYTTTDPATVTDKSKYVSTTEKYSEKTSVEIDGKMASTDVQAFVDEKGNVQFTGLGAGTYTIEEVVVPAGYDKAPNQTVTISFDADKKEFSSKLNGTEDVNFNSSINAFSVTVENTQGGVLPSTGGIGTTIFYVAGIVLVAGAAAALVLKRRKRA